MNQAIFDETSGLHVTGIVKWFDPVKGFGFILPDLGGSDVLLHVKVLRAWGVSSVYENSRMEVRAIKTDRGFQAAEIYSIEPPLAADMDDGVSLSDERYEDLLPARVKWFCSDKDYGFANAFGQTEDIFLSGAVLRSCGLASLEQGEAISLLTEQSNRGAFASHVLPWDAKAGVQ